MREQASPKPSAPTAVTSPWLRIEVCTQPEPSPFRDTLGERHVPEKELGHEPSFLRDGKPVLQLHVEKGPTPAEARPSLVPVPKPFRLANARPSLICRLGPQDGGFAPGRACRPMTSA